MHTSVSVKPKWLVEVGKIGYASPAIGPDGIIYVGLLSGQLVAVDPSGSIKWKRTVTTVGNPDYPGIITGSPAVGNDGNVYIITTVDVMLKDRRSEPPKTIQVRRSSLHSFTPSGNLRWSYRFPVGSALGGLGGFTGSSPKVWGDQNIFIFVPAIYASTTTRIDILVINQSGNLVNKTEVTHYASGIEEISSSWDFMKSMGDCDTLFMEGAHEKMIGWPASALSIVDVDLQGRQPIIVMADNYKTLTAYRWNFPVLTPLWAHCSDSVSERTPPAILPNNEILLSGKDGVMSCYDLKSGSEKHKPWYQAGKHVLGSPLIFEDHIYFIAGNELMMLNADFQVQARYVLTGQCLGSIALSANHMYISTTDGLYIISSHLKHVDKNTDIAGGISTPAIGHDGTVYVIDQNGTLFAI